MATDEKTSTQPLSESKHEDYSDLVLHNDNVNTFDFVIQSLIEICEHEPCQAEQCALLAHFKGKCTVKTGLPDKLEPYAKKMTNKGLSVSIQ
ncbi:MAG: ATP-dependent Clp protease adaptor ClpS [Lentimicrobiaceae bacterium]|nr:ATP-dependent Clp protease adaptor ClpS [Lentimicrobiaceae bacterium]